MAKFKKIVFKKLLIQCFDQEIISFRSRFLINRFPKRFMQDYNGEVNSKLSALHTSQNENQTEIFVRTADIYNNDIRLTFSEAIEVYLNSINKQIIINENILAQITSLYFVRNAINQHQSEILNNTFNSQKFFARKKNINLEETEKIVVNKLGLKDFIISEEVFSQLMKKLIQNEFCEEKTNKWICKDKGKKQKLCALLLALTRKNYYKYDKIPTYKNLKTIAINTFGVKVSIRSFFFPTVASFKKEFDFINAIK